MGTYRRSLDQSNDDPDTATVTIQSDTLDPEAQMINSQKVKLLREVVNKLKPRYRTLVELRYFKEYSYEEISQELELPIGTVKAQLFRARELLFNILKSTSSSM